MTQVIQTPQGTVATREQGERLKTIFRVQLGSRSENQLHGLLPPPWSHLVLFISRPGVADSTASGL